MRWPSMDGSIKHSGKLNKIKKVANSFSQPSCFLVELRGIEPLTS
jgi:hypothetical protein